MLPPIRDKGIASEALKCPGGALAERARLLEDIARVLQAEHPAARIAVAVTPQYRNMAQGLAYAARTSLSATSRSLEG